MLMECYLIMKYETLRRIEKNGVYIAEFDPKVHCKYNPNVLCIRLYLGKFECSGFVDNKKQFKEKHEMEIVFCHLFPELEKVKVLDVLEQEGFKYKRSWLE